MVWFNLAGGASTLGEFSCRDAAWGLGLCCSGGFSSPAPARGAQVAGPASVSWRCLPSVAADAWAAATVNRK